MAHAREAAARSSARGCLITVMVLVAIAGFVIPIIIGGVGLLMANVTDDRTDIPVDVTVPGAPAEPPRAELAGPAPGLLFTGGLAEMVELRRVLGDDLANARQLVVYPDRLVVEVEPPGTPGVVERWVVNPEQPPQGPQPVDVAAEQALAQRFALAEVDSGRLALSVVTAQAELARRGVPLTPSHLVVQRDPLGELRVWVYAGAADDRSIVQLTPAGDVVDVQLGG